RNVSNPRDVLVEEESRLSLAVRGDQVGTQVGQGVVVDLQCDRDVINGVQPVAGCDVERVVVDSVIDRPTATGLLWVRGGLFDRLRSICCPVDCDAIGENGRKDVRTLWDLFPSRVAGE